MATRVISIASRKGGSGKSSITMFLGTAIAKEKGFRVLLIDTDNQRTIMATKELEERIYPDEKTLVDVEEMPARHVFNFLQRFGSDYDVIFIDVPRMTDNDKDSATVQLLYYCDTVAIPVLGSMVDVMSTKDFLQHVEDTARHREEMKQPFSYFAFINRMTVRKENERAMEFLEKRVDVMDAAVRDLKIFTRPSLCYSVMDTREGERRFREFYTEFCKKTGI